MNCNLTDIATCNFLFQWLCLQFTVTNNSCQVWLCTKKRANTFVVVHLLNNKFFLQSPAFSCCFHSSIISSHCHSRTILLTHFTNNYYIWGWAFIIKQMQLHISQQLSTTGHPHFLLTIITHVGGSNGVNTGWDLCNNRDPFKSQSTGFNP